MKRTFLGVILILLFTHPTWSAQTPEAVTIPSDSCNKKVLPSPLGHGPKVFSSFNSAHDHYGVDFISKNEPVLAIAPGVIKTIDWNVKSLKTANSRSGMKIRGWGRYVVIRHDDGSESLYAHLDKDSTKDLKVGQAIKVGDIIGKSDTSGGASGPHLHFEYSPTGDVFDNASKVDPNNCIARQDWLTLESYALTTDGIGQIYIGGQLVGENALHQKTKFWVRLKPGKYSIRIVAKQVTSGRAAYFSVEMGKSMTILNPQGAETGPLFNEELHQGQEATATLKVE